MASSDSDAAYEVVRKTQVQEVLRQRRRKGVLEYLVRWKGYGKDEDSWEPESNLKNSALKIKEFLTAQTSTKKSRAASMSRSRSRSRSRTGGQAKRSTSRTKRSTSRSQSRGRTSRSTSRSRGSEKKAVEKVEKLVVEKVVEKTPETPVRQSRRIETLKQNKSLDSSDLSTERFTQIRERRDRVDGVLQGRMMRTEVTTVTTSSSSGSSSSSRGETASHSSSRLADLKSRAARIWATADTAVLIVFACISLIMLSFIVEKYFHWIPVAVGDGFKAGARQVQSLMGAMERNLQALGAYSAKLAKSAWAKIRG